MTIIKGTSEWLLAQGSLSLMLLFAAMVVFVSLGTVIVLGVFRRWWPFRPAAWVAFLMADLPVVGISALVCASAALAAASAPPPIRGNIVSLALIGAIGALSPGWQLGQMPKPRK